MVNINCTLYIRYGNYTVSMFTRSCSLHYSLNDIIYL